LNIQVGTDFYVRMALAMHTHLCALRDPIFNPHNLVDRL
jgi:hypothetical protein